jgi:hypothetical protein
LNYHHYCKTGAFHEDAATACQDAYCTAENASYALIAIADGVSACRYGQEGAKTVTAAIWDYIESEGENVFLFAPPKLAYLLTEHILYHLELTAWKLQADLQELASTAAFACIEKKSGKAVIGNLGDSLVFGSISGSPAAIFALKPPTKTPHTTISPDAHKKMSLAYRTLSFGDTILLGTDGFLHALRALDNHSPQFDRAVQTFDFIDLDSHLFDFPEPDDCTYVAVRHA